MIARYLLLLIILCTSFDVSAITEKNLCSINIPLLTTPSNTNLKAVFRQGLSQVLIKASGNEGILTLPTIKDAIKNAKNWVTDYSFNSQDDQTTISINYNQQSIMSLLHRSKQDIWGNQRPLTLLWLTTSNGQLINNNDPSDIKKDIEQAANKRGLPILFPNKPTSNHDDETSPLVAQNNIAPITLTVLNQYKADAMLQGSINSLSNPVTIQWQFAMKDDKFSWNSTGDSILQATSNGINQLSDTLANQEAITHDNSLETIYTLSVRPITSTPNYVKLLSELKQCSGIDSANTVRFKNQTVTLRITSALEIDAVMQKLAALKHLELDHNQQMIYNPSLYNISLTWTS
jgi:uncharacterized protein